MASVSPIEKFYGVKYRQWISVRNLRDAAYVACRDKICVCVENIREFAVSQTGREIRLQNVVSARRAAA